MKVSPWGFSPLLRLAELIDIAVAILTVNLFHVLVIDTLHQTVCSNPLPAAKPGATNRFDNVTSLKSLNKFESWDVPSGEPKLIGTAHLPSAMPITRNL